MNSKNIKLGRKFNTGMRQFGIELAFIATIFFFEIGKSIFGELRHLVDFFYAKMSEYSLMSILVPVKALFDISKVFSLVILVFKIILAIIGNPIMLFLCVMVFGTMLYICLDRKSEHSKEVILNKKDYYKYTSRFLC